MAVLDRSWLRPNSLSIRECGYFEQRDRIRDYQIVHTPESELPYVPDSKHPDGHPDGCGPCGKATWWESRKLADGRTQMRCSECHSTLTWDY